MGSSVQHLITSTSTCNGKIIFLAETTGSAASHSLNQKVEMDRLAAYWRYQQASKRSQTVREIRVGTCHSAQKGRRFRGWLIHGWWPCIRLKVMQQCFDRCCICVTLLCLDSERKKENNVEEEVKTMSNVSTCVHSKGYIISARKYVIFTNDAVLSFRIFAIYTHFPAFCTRPWKLRKTFFLNLPIRSHIK